MKIPGFNAEKSLRDGECYHNTMIVNALISGRGVMPQLFGIGFCMSGCRRNDWGCLFNCLSLGTTFQ
jgi:hypothetical protein